MDPNLYIEKLNCISITSIGTDFVSFERTKSTINKERTIS